MKLVVFSCVLAAAYASVVWPLAYNAPLAYSAGVPWGLTPYNYRGPLSLAPGQPANILGADGRPLDTLEVNQAKIDKALSGGIHFLKKRSAAVIPPITPATPILSRIASISHISPYSAYASPYATYW